MVTSKAATPDDYVASLPPDRAEVVARVRKLVNDNLPPGYRETMAGGMIGWGIPLSVYPDTYNKQPLSYAALAAQKNYYALYLLGAYAGPEQDGWLKEEFRKAGKKLDMGKSCIRFRSLDDLPLDVIGRAIASTPPEKMIALYEASRQR